MIEKFGCVCRALGWIKRLTSPVFFSTGEDGVTRQGLQGVPQRRPMLFVGNHQTYALDIGPLVAKLIEDREIFPRGLAHPAIWAVSIFTFFSIPRRNRRVDCAVYGMTALYGMP